MEDNTRTAIGYICITLVILGWFLMFSWISTPSEWTIKIEMDNKTFESVEKLTNTIQNVSDTRGHGCTMYGYPINCSEIGFIFPKLNEGGKDE